MKTSTFKNSCGLIKITYNDDVLYKIELVENEDITTEDNFTKQVKNELNEYLQGKRQSFTINYKLIGTEFQNKVWDALKTIPYGETRTYKEVAIMIGNPKACRAVGNANNKNPIPLIVPCHRVIGSNSSLVGYALGLELKETLLNLEKDK